MEKLLTCPICGATPVFEKHSMGRPGGHGYPDNFEVRVSCPNCKVPEEISVDDIYTSEDLYERATILWNKQVKKIKDFIANKTILKEIETTNTQLDKALEYVNDRIVYLQDLEEHTDDRAEKFFAKCEIEKLENVLNCLKELS